MRKNITMIPKTIKTDERVFKILTNNGDTYLCNLGHIRLDEIDSFKKVWHLWDFDFERFGKRQLVTMCNMQDISEKVYS